MRSGICPKCHSETVYATNFFDESFQLPRFEKETSGGKHVDSRAVKNERYVCVSCGYFERYVANREFLEQIKNMSTWIKV